MTNTCHDIEHASSDNNGNPSGGNVTSVFDEIEMSTVWMVTWLTLSHKKSTSSCPARIFYVAWSIVHPCSGAGLCKM